MDEHANAPGSEPLHSLSRLLIPAGILLLACLLRLLALDKGIWQDEYGSLRMISGENLIATLRAHNHPPLYYLVLKVFSLVAKNDSFLRLASVIAGVAAVFCMWLWIARYSRFGAACAALLAATHPFFVRYSQEMRMYGLLLLLTTLSFWLADLLRQKWSDWRLSAALTTVLTLAVSTHLVAVFVATTVLFYLGFWLLKERRRIPLTLILPIVAVPVTFLFLTRVFLTQVYDPATWWMERPSVALLSDIGRSYLGWPALVWFGEALQGGLPVLLLAGLLLLIVIPRPRFADLPLLTAPLVLALQLVLVSLLIVPVLVARTGLVVLVPAIAFIGVRLGRLQGRVARGFAIATVVAMAAIFSGWWLLVEGRKPFGPWKEVAGLIESRLEPADLVFVSPFYAQGPLRHYLRRLPPEGIVAFQPDAPAAFVSEVRARLSVPPASGCRRVWQVVREDQNVQRRRDGLDRIHATLVQLVGEPGRVERRGLVTITLYAAAGCREP